MSQGTSGGKRGFDPKAANATGWKATLDKMLRALRLRK
jgi:hypothetical protein